MTNNNVSIVYNMLKESKKRALAQKTETHTDEKPSKKRPLKLGKKEEKLGKKDEKLGKKWEKIDDDELKKLVAQYGTNKWDAIAPHFPLRSFGQCRDRWETILDPTLKRGGWTPEEDQTIVKMSSVVGNRWVQISKCLPGRTPNSVKNRSCSLQKKTRPPPPPVVPAPLQRSAPASHDRHPRPAAAPPDARTFVTPGATAPRRRTHVPDLLSPSSFLVFKPPRFQLEALTEQLAPLPSPSPNKIIENIYTDDCLFEMRHFLQEFGFQTDPVHSEGTAVATLQQLNLHL